MILVEGCDGAGKTTLIRELLHVFNVDVAPRVVEKDTTHSIDLAKWVDENLAKGFHPTLYDRYRLISEPIYGSVLPRGLASEFADEEWLNSRLEKLRRIQPVIIFCQPGLDEVKKNVEHDLDNEVVAPYVDKLYYRYRNTYQHMLKENPYVVNYHYKVPGTKWSVYEAIGQRLSRHWNNR